MGSQELCKPVVNPRSISMFVVFSFSDFRKGVVTENQNPKIKKWADELESLMKVISVFGTILVSCFYLLLSGYLAELSVPYRPSIIESIQFFILSFGNRLDGFSWYYVFISIFSFSLIHYFKNSKPIMVISSCLPNIWSGWFHEINDYKAEIAPGTSKEEVEHYNSIVDKARSIVADCKVVIVRLFCSFLIPVLILCYFTWPLLVAVSPVLIMIWVYYFVEPWLRVFNSAKLTLGAIGQSAFLFATIAVLGFWTLPYSMGRHLAMEKGIEPELKFPTVYFSEDFDDSGYLLWKNETTAFVLVCLTPYQARIKEIHDGKVFVNRSANGDQFDYFCRVKKSVHGD